MSLDSTLFAEPPATYRPQPFFVWNGQVTRERITECLEQFHAQGCGGAFIHARPGLITDYLSDEWFELFGHAVAEAKRLGMECQIYDENSFPTGFAGGHTMAANPLTHATALQGKRIVTNDTALPHRSGSLLGAYQRNGDRRYRKVNRRTLAEPSPESPVMTVTLERIRNSLWQAGFSYVDLCRPETTDTFLTVTHERYRERFGAEFGSTVKFAFADEPEALYGTNGLHCSRFFLREFRLEHGYNLADKLDALCFDTPDSTGVRFDYFHTLNRLFTQNFAKRCHDWCEAHGLQFTGHFMEHHWPLPKGLPSAMAALRWMQAPGIDLLAFQFSPTTPRENRLYLLNLRELASIANQCGRARLLTESCGGGGYDFVVADMKPLEDFLLAHGVNVINPHLSHESLAGSRKYDWPQTLSDHASWFDCYRPQADHIGRTAYALSRGQERNRVLLLQPTTTAWMHYRADAFRWPDEPPLNGYLEEWKETHFQVVLALFQDQIDFDLGDENVMEELARVVQRQLMVGQGAYELVVIPPSMQTINASTLALLTEYLENGGRLLAPVKPPACVNGRPDARVAALLNHHRDLVVRYGSIEALREAIVEMLPPRVRILEDHQAGTPASDLVWRRVELPDGEPLYFFCNPWERPLDITLTVDGGGLIEYDTATGKIRPSEAKPGAFRLQLPPGGHRLLLATRTNVSPQTAAPATSEEIEVTLDSTERVDPNLLFLDYCDLETPGLCLKEVNTIHADQANYHAQGWEQNPWRVSIQFRQSFLQNPPRPDSQLTLTYRFNLDAESLPYIRESLRIAVERPELYQLRINDHPLDPALGRRWFDEAMQAFPIGDHVVGGENRFTLHTETFHPLCEIMPAYLLGDFHLRAVDRGFVVEKPASLGFGDWTKQGLPFYPRAVDYHFRFILDRSAARLQVKLPFAHASAFEVAVDDQPAVPVVHIPHEALLNGPFEPGSHRLRVRAHGNLKNMMGPHFSDGLPGGWSWEAAPEELPPGEEYRVYPTGLFSTPQLKADFTE